MICFGFCDFFEIKTLIEGQLFDTIELVCDGDFFQVLALSECTLFDALNCFWDDDFGDKPIFYESGIFDVGEAVWYFYDGAGVARFAGPNKGHGVLAVWELIYTFLAY